MLTLKVRIDGRLKRTSQCLSIKAQCNGQPTTLRFLSLILSEIIQGINFFSLCLVPLLLIVIKIISHSLASKGTTFTLICIRRVRTDFTSVFVGITCIICSYEL